MKTPNNSRMYSGAGIISPENPLNSPGVSNSQGYNTFDLSNQRGITPRFAELTPFSVVPVVSGDRINLQSSHKLNTYTLSAPLLSEVRFNKDYFFVPQSCMLPNTWEYLFVNPNKGDDVPDDAYPVFDVKTFCRNLLGAFAVVANDTAETPVDNPAFGWIMALLYRTFGYGSLLDTLGYREHIFENYSLTKTAVSNSAGNFGTCMDNFFNFFIDNDDDIRVSLYHIDDTSGTTLSKSSLFLQMTTTINDASQVRRFFFKYFSSSEPLWLTVEKRAKNTIGAWSLVPLNSFKSILSPVLSFYNKYFHADTDFIKPYNLYRLIAYQMSCAQFYSNDIVDNVYSGKIWLQNMESIQRLAGYDKTLGQQSPTYFGRNGIQIRYDVFSKHNMDILIGMLGNVTQTTNTSEFMHMFMFFLNMFEYQHALRYGDYFAGGRTQPLAVGDIDITVNSGMVSAIDVTQGLSMQRFLNAVNRVGQLVADYARNIFGVAPKNLPPQPRFVNHESQVISGQTVVNTGNEQGTLNQNLTSSSSKFAYDVFIDEPGILIGICSFTCLPCYSHDTPRDIYHYDRLDDFQPFLQNIGDQQVYMQELCGVSNYLPVASFPSEMNKVFAYQLQDAEYKYGVSSACGAFPHVLKNWLFVLESNYDSIGTDFLRLEPTMFDKFYKSLTGFSTETYFHFIVSFVNKVTANRRMMYRPGIL